MIGKRIREINSPPRIGLSYEFLPEQVLKAAINVGYRNPTFGNIYFNQPLDGGALLILGNEDLEPEEFTWYEAGYSGQLTPNLSVGLDLFYVEMKDLIQPHPMHQSL